MQLATATGNLPLCVTRLWQLVSLLSSALNYKTKTKFYLPFFWKRDKHNLCWAKERTNWTWLELCVESNLACLILMDNAASKGIACMTELGGGGNIVLKLTLSESNISRLPLPPPLKWTELNCTALNWAKRRRNQQRNSSKEEKQHRKWSKSQYLLSRGWQQPRQVLSSLSTCWGYYDCIYKNKVCKEFESVLCLRSLWWTQ